MPFPPEENSKMRCFHVFRVLEDWEDGIMVRTTSQLCRALRTSINTINTELGMSCLAGERGDDALTQNEPGSLSWHGGRTWGVGVGLWSSRGISGVGALREMLDGTVTQQADERGCINESPMEHFHLPQKLRGGRIKHSWTACEPLWFPGLQKIPPLLGYGRKKPNSICLGAGSFLSQQHLAPALAKLLVWAACFARTCPATRQDFHLNNLPVPSGEICLCTT